MSKLTTSSEWVALERHAERAKSSHLRELFRECPQRFEKFSLRHGRLLVDFSKQRVDETTMRLLHAFADSVEWQAWVARMCAGDEINHTEGRSVGHWRLRAGSKAPVSVHEVLEQVALFSGLVRSGNWLGVSGQQITNVVNIGIGGSDLGPRMVVEALYSNKSNNIRLHFVANLDGADLGQTLEPLDPARTLFIVASKTFVTQETMANAVAAREWLLRAFNDERNAIGRHFVAVTANVSAAKSFGIPVENIFPFSDWVGGRFSLWSSVGLSIAVAVGFERFRELLAGAQDMDGHFFNAPARNNIPLTLALLSLWNRNFLKAGSQGIFPYSHALRSLPQYLQQLEMESNGKSVDRDGEVVDYLTGTLIWGGVGTNSQHSFFQLLHQGTELVASEFVAVARPDTTAQNHTALLANCLAQSSALAFGKTVEEVRSDGIEDKLTAYRIFPGNQPSTTIVLPELSPFTLGQLIAAYEHKVFCLGVFWNLNSFDQWGVELGKRMATQLLPVLDQKEGNDSGDASTVGLVAHIAALGREVI